MKNRSKERIEVGERESEDGLERVREEDVLGKRCSVPVALPYALIFYGVLYDFLQKQLHVVSLLVSLAGRECPLNKRPQVGWP